MQIFKLYLEILTSFGAILLLLSWLLLVVTSVDVFDVFEDIALIKAENIDIKLSGINDWFSLGWIVVSFILVSTS